MAFDEGLADRARAILRERVEAGERRMFGGLAFMVHGHMACGIMKDELMVRVGAEAHGESLAQPHARPMDFTGKPMRGFVIVGAEGLRSRADLAAWVERGLSYVSTLAPK
jgi:TfoX/Sxy family transcriptional regulator of competence genes